MIPGKLPELSYKMLCTKKKGESGFSYRFNLNVSLNFDKLLQIKNIHFCGVVSM